MGLIDDIATLLYRRFSLTRGINFEDLPSKFHQTYQEAALEIIDMLEEYQSSQNESCSCECDECKERLDKLESALDDLNSNSGRIYRTYRTCNSTSGW